MQPADAVAPFLRLAGLGAGEIVAAGAGMGVDDAEGRRLVAQMHQHAAQHRVLDDVGEISGVIGVAVVHRARCRCPRDLNRNGCRSVSRQHRLSRNRARRGLRFKSLPSQRRGRDRIDISDGTDPRTGTGCCTATAIPASTATGRARSTAVARIPSRRRHHARARPSASSLRSTTAHDRRRSQAWRQAPPDRRGAGAWPD